MVNQGRRVVVHRIVAILTGIVLLAGLAPAEPVPGSPLGVAFGEGSRNLDHFLDYIHDLGVSRTKVSFYWHELEPQPGVYDFSVLDQYLSQLGPDDQALLNVFTSGWCTEEQGPCKGSPLVDSPTMPPGARSPVPSATARSSTPWPST